MTLADPLLETGDTGTQDHLRPDHAPVQRLSIDDALMLPALLSLKELAQVWGVTRSQAHRLARAGHFDFLKLSPAVGPKCFSGVLVRRYLSGEPVYLPTFGQSRKRRT